MRIPRVTLALFLLIAAARPAASQSAELPIREHVLDNGLTLLVLERPDDHRVAAKIFTDFGALVEVPGLLGAAHFLEHLMFKGTPSLGTGDWAAERPIRERILALEAEREEARNAARNALRQRGVFHDYRHRESTPEIDSLQAEIDRLEAEAQALYDNGAMMRWYQAYGGTRLTATTEQEYMKFDINLPVDRIELFFRVEADRMQNTVFREFDQERMILVEQRYGDLNRPTTPYYEAMNATAHAVHPVFWPEGYLTDFGEYTRAYERALFDEYFVPNNTTIVLVGGVPLEEAIPLAERWFGGMPRAPEPGRARAVEPVPQAERRLIWRSDTLEPRVEARYGIPGIGHPDRPAFDVLGPVAEREIADALKAAGVTATVTANTRVVHTSRFGVPATLNFEVRLPRATELERAEDVMLATLDRLGMERVSDERVARVKKRLRAEWYRTAADPDALAFEIGHFQVMDRYTTLADHLARRQQATASQLARLARGYFGPENRTIGVVRPERESEPGRGGNGDGSDVRRGAR